MNLANTMLQAEEVGAFDMAERLHSSANRQGVLAMALSLVRNGTLTAREAMEFKPQANYNYVRPDGTVWLGGKRIK